MFYENFDYPENSVVVDNPPFSIISKIIRFYNERGIKYFLFAPHLTLFGTNQDYTCIIADAQVIYELRNSFLHSFGLFSKSRTATYYFQVSSSRQDLVTKLSVGGPDYYYRIDLYTLRDKFEQSIAKYKKDLETDNELQKNFDAMFNSYGMVHPANTYFHDQIIDSETT